MKDFHDIEKEYLRLEPLDNLALEKYYNNHIDYFHQIKIDNTEQFYKSLNILIDIACSYSFADRHKEAIKLINQIKKLIPNEIPTVLKQNVNQLYFCGGQSHLALKKYRQALSNFKAYKSTNKDTKDIAILKKFCRDNIQNRILLILAGFGLTILIVKYSTQYIFTDYQSNIIDKLGWFGALTLIAYGLFTKSTKKKNTA